jgi:hypothetical protein
VRERGGEREGERERVLCGQLRPVRGCRGGAGRHRVRTLLYLSASESVSLFDLSFSLSVSLSSPLCRSLSESLSPTRSLCYLLGVRPVTVTRVRCTTLLCIFLPSCYRRDIEGRAGRGWKTSRDPPGTRYWSSDAHLSHESLARISHMNLSHESLTRISRRGHTHPVEGAQGPQGQRGHRANGALFV